MTRSDHILTVIAGAAIAACNTSAQAAPFAIACTGKARFSQPVKGKPVERSYALPTQIYVFDEATKRVQHALTPRQQFEDVCFRGGYIDSTTFTPGLISVRSEKKGAMCDFNVDRASGKGEYASYNDLPSGGVSTIDFEMTCDRTDVPVFNPTKNKF